MIWFGGVVFVGFIRISCGCGMTHRDFILFIAGTGHSTDLENLQPSKNVPTKVSQYWMNIHNAIQYQFHKPPLWQNS